MQLVLCLLYFNGLHKCGNVSSCKFSRPTTSYVCLLPTPLFRSLNHTATLHHQNGRVPPDNNIIVSKPSPCLRNTRTLPSAKLSLHVTSAGVEVPNVNATFDCDLLYDLRRAVVALLDVGLFADDQVLYA